MIVTTRAGTMVELADTKDLKSFAQSVRVQIPVVPILVVVSSNHH